MSLVHVVCHLNQRMLNHDELLSIALIGAGVLCNLLLRLYSCLGESGFSMLQAAYMANYVSWLACEYLA